MIMLNQQFYGFLLMWQFLHSHEAVCCGGTHEAGCEHYSKVLAVHSVVALERLHSTAHTHTRKEGGEEGELALSGSLRGGRLTDGDA